MAARKTTDNSGGGLAGLMGKAKKPASKSSSSTPQVTAPKTLESAVQAYVEAKRDMKDAESRKKSAGDQIGGWAEEQRVAVSRRDGQVHSSIKVNAPKAAVSWVAVRKCKQMFAAEGANETLESIFGADFSRLFHVAPQISIGDLDAKGIDKLTTALKSAGLLDLVTVKINDNITEEQIGTLTEALTKAKLLDLVELNPLVQPTEAWFNETVLKPKVAAMTEEAQEQHGLCQQTKYVK